MYSKKLYSPLRYPGGKAPFAPFIAKVMETNGVKGGHYMEPYAGGAGVALTLLLDGHASHIHINDADPAIHAFWVSVTKHSGALLSLLESTPITIDEWFKWRSILRGEIQASLVEKGFATLFMNRTNRSGILKAGVIGGQKQDGEYKLDARFKKDIVGARIQEIAKHSKNISIYCEDSLGLLNRCSEFLPKKSLIYLDPPYYVKGKGLYRNYYKHDDHIAIAKALQNKAFKWPWVVSYDNTEEICAMYQLSQSLTYGLNYTAQRRYVGNEVMFFSQNTQVPGGDIPQTKAVG
ncbi:DNA adenine methylase [Pseudomonas abyssi]|uniref:site-specific DNA-methyltransferase (adenine-specific) n=1 Tax=Pseudomonas abyssi TaxID=170540 RepID=A0A395QZS0_9PSED|nr:DNA adenine methylase [Halopseudomonas gallaeciensis]RGP53380.1 DNA methyltransferase [Halopseudomonas gallaeciensis]